MPRPLPLALLALLAGCGLVLDLDPPDAPEDAAQADAGGVADAGAGIDGGGSNTDAGAACGDGTIDPGEDCDDGNDVDDDGCTVECRFGCASDADCEPDDACLTSEGCDLASHRCRAPTDVACAVPETCTRLTGCDPVLGCRYEPLPEVCDGIDQDCDGVVDEGTGIACAADVDGDGYGDPGDVVTACEGGCPTGRVPNEGDCWDGPPSEPGTPPGPQLANPDQINWFQEPRGDGTGSYDWNCDGVEQPRRPDLFAGCSSGPTPCARQSGWAVAVPACGGTGEWVACLAVGSGICEEARSPASIQACR